MIGSIFSKIEKKRTDFERTILSMNREREDSEDDDGPNSPSTEWNSRGDYYDVMKNDAGERILPWLETSMDSSENHGMHDEYQAGNETEEEEDNVALAALSPLLKRAGLVHLLQTLIARGCRTPEQLVAAATRGDESLEELGLKRAHILKLHRALEEEDIITTREVGVQPINAEGYADFSDESSAKPGLSSVASSSSDSSLASSSSEEEDDDEDEVEVAAEDAARRLEWQRTLATEEAVDDAMVNLVQRTIDEDRVRKEAKRAWRAQQAFNEAKKKAEAGAKQAHLQRKSPARAAGKSNTTKVNAPRQMRPAPPHLTPSMARSRTANCNSTSNFKHNRSRVAGTLLTRPCIFAAVAAVIVGVLAVVLGRGPGWHYFTSPQGPYGLPYFSERVLLESLSDKPLLEQHKTSASIAIEDWDKLPEPGVTLSPSTSGGLIDLTRRAANTRSSGGGSVTQLLKFWTGATMTAEAESAQTSSSFEWASSEAALALSKLRHRAIIIAGLKIHFIHELANIPEPTPEQQQRYEAKMRRHRRRGNVYAQAGDESDENDSPPSDGPPSVTKRTLLLVHEWPVGSVVDFVHVIPILTQPQCLYGPRKPPSKKDNFIEDKGQDEDVPSCMAFDVVAPSLPGFGWSDAVINNKDANQNAFDALAAGRVLLTLMDQLNITEYWIHGGKHGGVIGAGMVQLAHADASALKAPNPLAKPAVAGLHLTQLPTSPFTLGAAAAPLLATLGVLGGPRMCERVAAVQVQRDCNVDTDDYNGSEDGQIVGSDRSWGVGFRGALLGRFMGEYNNSISSTGGVGVALAGSGKDWLLDEKERWCSVFAERSKGAYLHSMKVGQLDASSGGPHGERGIDTRENNGTTATSSGSSSKSSSWLSWHTALSLLLQEGRKQLPSAKDIMPGLNVLAAALDDSPAALAAFHLETAVASISRQQCPSESKQQGSVSWSANAETEGDTEYEKNYGSTCRNDLEEAENDRKWRELTALKEEGQPGSDWLAANLHVAWFHPIGANLPLQLFRNAFGNPESRTWRSLNSVVPGPVAVSDYPGDQHRWPAPLLALRFPNLARVARQETASGRNSRFAALDQPRDFAAEVARSVEAMVEVRLATEAAAREEAEAAAESDARTNAQTAKSTRSAETSTSSKSSRAKPLHGADFKQGSSSSSSSKDGRSPPTNVGMYRAAGTLDGSSPRAAHGNVAWGPPDLSTKTAKYPAGTLMYDPDLHGSKRPKDGVFRPKETWKPLDVFSRK